jgi:hypothetical protein
MIPLATRPSLLRVAERWSFQSLPYQDKHGASLRGICVASDRPPARDHSGHRRGRSISGTAAIAARLVMLAPNTPHDTTAASMGLVIP